MFATYFSQHILMSALKQAFFMQRFGSQEWDYQSKTGKLTFGRKTVLQTEVLGTYSKDSRTWLWAWGNQYSPIPEERTRISRSLRQFGNEKNIPELTTAEVPVTQEVDHRLISLLSIGLAKLPAYFAATHDHGSVMLAVTTPDCNPMQMPDNLELINHISNVLTQIPVTSQREALIGFCNALKWKGEERGSILSIRNPTSGEAIEFTLDAHQRIASMSTKMVSPPK